MMEKIKEQALEKMLKEMEKEHSSAEDAIHNWLCDQENTDLFAGILEKDKSIKEAVQYCMQKAREKKTGNVAMIDDETVFRWVAKYFTGKKIKVQKVAGSVEVAAAKPKKKVAVKSDKKEVKDDTEQISLFDCL